MQYKLYYNNELIHKIREYRQGGQNMAEITICVPRKTLTEDKVAILLDDESSQVKVAPDNVTITSPAITIQNNSEDAARKNEPVVIAKNKEEEIILGVLHSDDYERKIKELGLNSTSIKSVLDGVTKTHKGYSFELKDVNNSED